MAHKEEDPHEQINCKIPCKIFYFQCYQIKLFWFTFCLVAHSRVYSSSLGSTFRVGLGSVWFAMLETPTQLYACKICVELPVIKKTT